MKRATRFLLTGALMIVSLSLSGTFVRAQEPLDGPHRPFKDELLENLAGDWKLARQIRGQTLENTVQVDWVLNHQFLRIHMKDVATPARYEAMVFVGYDNTSDRYVAHWIDVFGGRFSETLGYGKRDGNSIKFVFEYPDGPFHNTFSWNAAGKTWTFLMEQKNKEGKWTTFATDTLRRP
jgi:hypothetical protein